MTDTVAGGSQGAQEQPQFVIEKGNRFYLTAAVYEYDPDAPGATQAQKDAVEQYRRMFQDAASRNQLLRACEVGADVDTTEGINTGSHAINTGSESPEGINTGPPSPPGINTGDD
jgi:hypothetical protein